MVEKYREKEEMLRENADERRFTIKSRRQSAGPCNHHAQKNTRF